MGNGALYMEDEEKRITLLRVSNGDSEYPGNFTYEERNIIIDNLIYPVLNLFSGKSDFDSVNIDFVYGNHVCKDVFNFLQISLLGYRTVIIDAPYNQRFADKYQKLGNTPKQFIIFANAKKTTELFNRIDRIDPDIIILKSWNYYCLERYTIKKCYICYAGGYRKPTFLIIMEKKQNKLETYL